MLKQTELLSLKKGETVDHYALLKKMEVRNTKAGKPYLCLEVCDKSGTLSSNIWDNFEGIVKNFKAGDIVKLSGVIEEYLGNPQIKISKITPTGPEEKVGPADFMQHSKRNLKEMLVEFNSRMSKISDPLLKLLMKQIFNENDYRKFAYAPAGKGWHHAYISGLIEHTLELVKICDLMCDIHPEIHRDLLICGAMMHDFGKIEELKIDNSFDYSDKGKLIGHIVIAAIKISEECAKIKDFPEDLKNCLMHIVLSHQGKLEFASPVVPKTLEAITLYHADELSAKVNAYKNSLANKEEAGWTKYINLAATDLYYHGIKQEEEIKETLFP